MSLVAISISHTCYQSLPCKHDIELHFTDGSTIVEKAIPIQAIIKFYKEIGLKMPLWFRSHASYLSDGSYGRVWMDEP